MNNEYNLRCPKCHQDKKFSIVASHTITVEGYQIDHNDSLSWDDDDPVTCGECKHEGTVEDFSED